MCVRCLPKIIVTFGCGLSCSLEELDVVFVHHASRQEDGGGCTSGDGGCVGNESRTGVTGVKSSAKALSHTKAALRTTDWIAGSFSSNECVEKGTTISLPSLPLLDRLDWSYSIPLAAVATALSGQKRLDMAKLTQIRYGTIRERHCHMNFANFCDAILDLALRFFADKRFPSPIKVWLPPSFFHCFVLHVAWWLCSGTCGDGTHDRKSVVASSGSNWR
jgi:hypothetical protein